MAKISNKDIFGRLNSLCYRSAESAVTFAKLRGNSIIEPIHFINQVLQLQDSDIHRILKHFRCEPSRVAGDVQAALERLPRDGTGLKGFSGEMLDAVTSAWVIASLRLKEMAIRSGHLVAALADEKDLAAGLRRISGEFSKIDADALINEYEKIVAGSPEDALSVPASAAGAGDAQPGEASGAIAPASMGKQEALKRFSVDLTEKARTGELDPVVGREDEVRQIVDILMRRRQNNPILTGEPGVGKTAVVEGFAQRVASGDVPPPLKEISVRALDLTLLQAGASMKGEFEQRLRSVIEEVQQSPKPIVLFIDEAHNLVGAGGQAGTGDAANLLKPALARGTLRTIAATTHSEYKQYFEKDPALTRRFQVVQVDEPSEAKAVMMLRGLASVMEKHHKVQLLDEALEAAVKLSHRYIPARQLPDKAISLLDTACARVAVGQHATPAAVEDTRRRIEALEVESGIIAKETAVGVDHVARKKDLEENLAGERDRLKTLEQHWAQERELVTKILDIRSKLRGSGDGRIESAASQAGAGGNGNGNGHSHATPAATAATAAAPGGGGASAAIAVAVAPAPAAPTAVAPAPASAPAEVGLSAEDREKLLGELKTHQSDLSQLQGESPLILPSVDSQAIASVVADWTGIPVGRMVKNEIDAVLKLADTLEKRVIGQRHALDVIARRIQTSRAGLDNPNRPVGVFMLAGPSGVGKTETALSLAEALYGGEQNMITLNMSEFQDEQSASTLKGAAPGLVGYGRGGILTEAVRRRPYSVVLLDEMEKAHKDIHEMFFQVFDKGVMEDTEGNEANFRNTIIILTSNAGQDVVVNMTKDPDLMPAPEAIEPALRAAMIKVFPDALLNRLTIVPYMPISKAMLQSIIKLNLSRVKKRVEQTHKVPFTFDEGVPQLIAERCTELERGARMVDAMITNAMLPDVSRELLNRMMEGKAVGRIHVTRNGDQFGYQFD